MSKILCPVDFSPASLNALEYATRIAEKSGSVLNIFHFFTEEEFNEIVSEEKISKSFKELLGLATSRLENIANVIMKEGKRHGLAGCHASVELGELGHGIAQKAAEGHQLIVMGTTGLGAKGKKWMGSNTSNVIKKSTVPVLSVPESTAYSGFKKMVYASDFYEEDKIKIQDVIAYATMFDARINVVHFTQGHNKLEEIEIRNFFTELESFVQYRKIEFESRSYKSDLSHALLDYMEEVEGDLLAIYSRERGFVEALMHKSVAKKLSVISNKPVLILK
ncbi:MAG: universal stress protein [Cyclobacteriaceae bacterium]|nr:universal stress protein [Cyclobacteriaceae bacterium]